MAQHNDTGKIGEQLACRHLEQHGFAILKTNWKMGKYEVDIVAYKDGWGNERCYGVQDYSAAIENMLLAITALGYASCWIEGHVTDADEQGKQIAKLLGVPEEESLICVLPVGRAADPVKRVRKKPFAERAHFNQW